MDAEEAGNVAPRTLSEAPAVPELRRCASESRRPFGAAQLGRWTYARPIENQHSLKLRWPLRAMRPYYREKPLEYTADL